MEPIDKNGEQSGGEQGKHVHSLPGDFSRADRQAAADAHKEADKDIARDADLSIHSPNDDLDEGETARLGGDRNDLV